ARGHEVARYGRAVDREQAQPLVHAFGIAVADLERGAAELARHAVLPPVRRDAGVDAQPVVVGLDAEDVLGDRVEVPGRRAGQPRVFAFSRLQRFLALYDVRVDVGLDAPEREVDLPCRRDTPVVVERPIAASQHGLAEHDPRIVVAEDAAVLLLAGRVGRDLPVL